MKAITLQQGLTVLAEMVSFRDDTEILRELKSVNDRFGSSVPTGNPHQHDQHREYLNIEVLGQHRSINNGDVRSDHCVKLQSLNYFNGSDR